MYIYIYTFLKKFVHEHEVNNILYEKSDFGLFNTSCLVFFLFNILCSGTN